jgi:DME family drug/metabolite transporter
VALNGIVALNLPSGETRIDLLGVGFSLAAAFAYSWQATGMGVISRRHNAFQSVAPIFTLGTLLQAPINYGRSFEFLADPTLMLGALYGGVATVAVAYALFTYGIARIGTATAVTVGLMEPLTSTVLGVTVLGEVITPVGVVGLVAILLGLMVVSMPDRSEPNSRPT